MKRLIFCLTFIVLALCGITHAISTKPSDTDVIPEPPVIKTEHLSLVFDDPAPDTDILQEKEPLATREEIELIAICTMAEAEGESEYGQRLVIDSILNRVDHARFPNTISEVVWQKNQYAGMYGERIKRCYVMDSLVKLVEEELENRTDFDVIFFNANHYSKYGVPMFQEGNHYFSSYD
jgi:N-acetylmuramoyl-L-alanine amidase